jgi:hypothetical protein
MSFAETESKKSRMQIYHYNNDTRNQDIPNQVMEKNR